MTKKIYKYGLLEIQDCVDLSDVARLLDLQPRLLSRAIYKTSESAKYSSFSIPKKGGGSRDILSPNKSLKFIQSRLSRLLYQCYFDMYGQPDNLRRVISHGFQKRRNLSIFTNASRHTSRRHVLNLDLADFFPTLNFGRVRGFFIKHDKFKLGDKAATAIAQLACFRNALPQGAPSSPIISEFLAQPLDIALQKLAKAHRCTYSRYVDDITFSTNLRVFPNQLALSDAATGKWLIGPSLQREIVRSGFEINTGKTRMQSSAQWQAATGLTVNTKVNINKTYYKGARYCTYSMMTKGEAHASDELNLGSNKLTASQIWGKLRHICYIKDRANEKRPLRHYNSGKPAPHYLRLSADYFHYFRIHTSPKPIILCEGKTDYVYLKEAILWNRADERISSRLIDFSKFPAKGKKVAGDHWKVDFMKHTKTTDRFLDLDGGGGDLVNFCRLHVRRTEKFHAATPQSPVIVIVDNDSQSKGMWSFIKKETKSSLEIDGSQPYYKLLDNLFVVPIPRSANSPKELFIELLFPEKWLQQKIDGRKLNLNQSKGKKLESGEFGKGEFASKVIQANRGNVDCKAFLPLLHTMCDIIEGKAL
jgi:RNA-directed DNA polymerase